MEQFKNIRRVDLETGEPAAFSVRQLYYADKNANRIGAMVYANGDPIALTGTCSGTAIRADGTTVPMTGAISGTMAYVDLIQDCYAIEGEIRIFVKITSGNVTETLAAAVGTVRLTETNAVIDPGTIIPSVSALISAIDDAIASIPTDYSALLAAIAPVYTDLTFPVKKGRFCWYSGTLYTAKQDINTSESWTASHWIAVPLSNNLAERIDNLDASMDIAQSSLDTMNELPSTETETTGKYLNTNRPIGTTLGDIIIVSANWNFLRFPVSAGDRFLVTGTGGTDPLVWAFTDAGTSPDATPWSNKGCKLLSKGGQSTTLTDEVITAPDDGWLLVNHKKSDTFSLRTLAVNPLAQQVATAQTTATDAKNTAESLLFNASVTSAWENGTIQNGSNSSNDARLRTKTYIQTSARKVAASGTYDFAVIAFDASAGTYAGCIKADGTIGIPSSFTWHTSVDLSGYTGYKFRLILRNLADKSSAMDVSESSNCTILCYTDDSLAFSGAAADAKATGDRLNALYTEAQYGHYQVRRNNPEYVSAMLTVAQSYMAANSDTILRNSKHFEYGNNSILQVSTSTNLIDCSTFVGLVLRGYSLTDTSYMADVSLRNPVAWVAKSGVAWAIDPYDWKLVSKPGEDPSRLRWAAQLAQWMEERGQVVPMDSGLADVMPGDILFWAKKTSDGSAWVEPKRYKHISHVGFCLSRTKTPADDPDVDASVYPYKHMTIEVGHETYDEDETTVLQGCVKSKLVEYEPADSAEWETTNNIHTLVLVCRPDLGSI